MKKSVLRKSLEEVMATTLFKITLTGDLKKDLGEYFHIFYMTGMFKTPKKSFGFDVESNNCIAFAKIDQGYCYCPAILYLRDLTFGKYNMDDYETSMKYFVAPLTELMEQMKQYYIDHDITPKSTD